MLSLGDLPTHSTQPRWPYWAIHFKNLSIFIPIIRIVCMYNKRRDLRNIAIYVCISIYYRNLASLIDSHVQRTILFNQIQLARFWFFLLQSWFSLHSHSVNFTTLFPSNWPSQIEGTWCMLYVLMHVLISAGWSRSTSAIPSHPYPIHRAHKYIHMYIHP